jgi:alpha-acetolactate decarboxylase
MKSLKSYLCLVLFVMVGASCNKSGAQNHTLSPMTVQPSFTMTPKALSTSVTIHGTLREIMHMGRIKRRVNLSPMIGQSGLYGLGALEDLSGEVTIWDGQLWLSTPNGLDGAIAKRYETTPLGATLLVTSEVTRWQERPITQTVTFHELDAFIEREAQAMGLDVTKAFPFRIEGVPTRLDWHVIDGSKIPKDAHGHEAHMRTAVRGSLLEKKVRIIGFYSPKHHTIFTHHNTNTHAHVISEFPPITGHIDHVEITKGSRLYFPIP